MPAFNVLMERLHIQYIMDILLILFVQTKQLYSSLSYFSSPTSVDDERHRIDRPLTDRHLTDRPLSDVGAR